MRVSFIEKSSSLDLTVSSMTLQSTMVVREYMIIRRKKTRNPRAPSITTQNITSLPL